MRTNQLLFYFYRISRRQFLSKSS